MDDATHATWYAYVRLLADRMGLRDWEVRLMRDAPDDHNAGASMSCFYQRKIVQIRLNGLFPAMDPETQRHYIVHELVHVHLDEIDSTLNDAREIIGGDAFSMMEKVIDQRIEFAVDALAGVLAPSLPLPAEDPLYA